MRSRPPSTRVGEFEVLVGDCRVRLRDLASETVDSVVSDPPYELAFMGKGWDASGVANDPATWREVLRVLKPGGHLISFGATRTYHRMACAVEDVGFEIRDSFHWIYGSGFPKSLDVAKAIDKAAGAVREVVGHATIFGATRVADGKIGFGDYAGAWDITKPATAEARAWEGWGTALKPAHEPAVVARKPFAGTVAANVLRYGTGAIDVEGARVGADVMGSTKSNGVVVSENRSMTGANYGREPGPDKVGRWPANVIADEEALAEFPEQARSFFYCPKPGRRERDHGCEGLPTRTASEMTDRAEGSAGIENPRAGSAPKDGAKNYHPTVKPVALMRYLVRLVTPPGGVVLDPFTGSGTTGVAALLEGYDFLGCELTKEYLPIINARLLKALEDRRKEIADGA